MTNINAIAAQNVVIEPAGSGNKPLGQADFLRLMTTQLRAQDPFDPLDQTQMVAQMAQFSSVAGITEMNVALRDIAAQLENQTELLTQIRAATTPPVQSPQI
jgi:flagellar basal-body rod modification protein FlgD